MQNPGFFVRMTQTLHRWQVGVLATRNILPLQGSGHLQAAMLAPKQLNILSR